MVETSEGAAPPVRQGSVHWLAPDPARDALRHPHVVLQDDLFNASRIATTVVCALSSNLHKAAEPGNVLLAPGEGNLPRQSVVVVSQLSVVDKALLGDPIGRLDAGRIRQILSGLRFQQAAFLQGR